MKKLLSIVLLFSCLLETTPWNTMQPCIASTITPSEQIVENDNSSISTENSLISYYDVYGEVYKQEPISVTSSSITLPNYQGRQKYVIAHFVGWTYGTQPVYVYPGDNLSRYTFFSPGDTCMISKGVNFAPLFVYSCTLSSTSIILDKNTLSVGETTTCSVRGFSNEYVTYSCEDPSIARIESDGTITALRAGTTKILASVYRKYDGYDVPESFSLEQKITVYDTCTPTPTMELLADSYVYYFDANGSCYSSTFICGINGSTRLPSYKSSLLADNETFIGWKQGNAPIIYDTKDSIDYNNILYPNDKVDIPRNTYFYPVILRENRTTTTSLPSQVGDSNTDKQPQTTPTLTPTVSPASSPQVGNDQPNKQPQVTPTLTPRSTPVPTTTATQTVLPEPEMEYNKDLITTPLVATTLPPTKFPSSTPQAEIWEPLPTNISAATAVPQVTHNQNGQPPKGTAKPQNKPITYSKPKRVKNRAWKKFVLHFSKVANATGYQIKYSRTKNGKGKTITTKSCKKNMKPYHLKGKYYIKIRAYKKIDGTTIYGSWTITKKKF